MTNDNAPATRAEANAKRASSLFILTAAFWSYTTERVLKTFLQAFAASAFATGVAVGLHEVEWLLALSIAGGAALLSFLTAAANYARPPATIGGTDADTSGE